MRYRNILNSHKKYQFGIINRIHLVGVDMIEIANSILIIETYFKLDLWIWKHLCFEINISSQENFLRDAQNDSNPALPELADAVKEFYNIPLLITVDFPYVVSRQCPSNKWINFAYRLPFPMARSQWKHLPAQIIYPRLYSQIRSEKSRSIRNAHRVVSQSQREKICYRPTILKGLPCYPSTVAMQNTQLTK